MKRFVEITTPIPTVDEVAESIGVSKSRLKRLQRIVDGTYVPKRSEDMATGLDGRHRDRNGRISEKRSDTKIGTLRAEYGDDFLRGTRSDAHLGTVRKETGKSLTELVREYKSSNR
jgi:hypothetical protein